MEYYKLSVKKEPELDFDAHYHIKMSQISGLGNPGKRKLSEDRTKARRKIFESLKGPFLTETNSEIERRNLFSYLPKMGF